MRDDLSFMAAMSAADTGHLVLSTLHTTTAALAITRILDFRTCVINYHDGARYPHLVRNNDQPDYLDDLIKPRASGK